MKPIHHKSLYFSFLGKLKSTVSAIMLLIMAVAYAQKSFGNAAQPGVWSAGGTIFTMLYPEDSTTFKKVQMQQERIYIQLYKGYAVVKGVYLFRNTTDEKLSFKMGYPINGLYSGGEHQLNQIIIDSLSHFKIKAQDQWLPLLSQPNPAYGKFNSFNDNWKVWDIAFSPRQTQTVEVYFIVNTNNASIKKGYSYDRRNAFIYLLESGSVWQAPIEKGWFYIQLMDGLTTRAIHGISSGFNFQYNEQQNIYAGTKTNFVPTPKDNLVVTYLKHNKKFVFDSALARHNDLYAQIDELSAKSLEALTLTPIKLGDPYKADSTMEDGLASLLLSLAFLAPVIIGVIIALIIIYFLIKYFNTQRKKKNAYY